jgi:hypothetical protein
MRNSPPFTLVRHAVSESVRRMAVGLGMTDAEWEDLKAQVDDSFWVLRIIGPLG